MKQASIISIFILLFSISAFAQTDEKSNCPKVSVTSPAERVVSGQEMIFTANINGVDLSKYKIVWRVDKGKIMQGQGTPIIIVSTQGLSQELINANVNLKGISTGCISNARGFGIVSKIIEISDPDEFGDLPEEDVKNRIDNLLIELTNDKNATAYIVSYGSLDNINARKNLIINHIRQRKFDESRITFVDGGRENSIRTRLWVVSCKNIIIKSPDEATTPSENMTFSVSVNQVLYNSSINYRWTVDKGTIIRGQGTDLIVVNTLGFDDTVINATVELEGLPKQCESKFSEAGIVADSRIGDPVDDFKDLEDEEIQIIIDSFLIRLQGDPKAKGLIINYGSREDVLKRENLIKQQINFRGFDTNRIVFRHQGKEPELRTILWIVPEGADDSIID